MPSPAFIVCRLFDSSHSDRCEMVPHCGFDLPLIMNEVEHVFMCLLVYGPIYFYFCFLCLRIQIQKHIYCDLYQRMYCLFFLGVLWFPALYLSLLSEIIFVCGLRNGSNFILFTCDWTVFWTPETRFSNTLKGVCPITKWDLSEGYKNGSITLYLVWLVYHKPMWYYIRKLKNKNHMII